MPKAFLWLRPSNKVWYATLYRDGKKKYHSLGTTDKEVAEAKFQALQASQGTTPKPEKPELPTATLQDLLPTLSTFLSDLSPSTIVGIYLPAVQSLVSIVGNKPLNQYRPIDAELWKATMASRMKPTSVNIRLRHLKALFNRMMEQQMVDSNPFKKTRSLKVEQTQPKYLSLQQVGQIIDAIPQESIRAIVMGGIATGCRRNELTTLRWEQVDIEGRKIILLRTKTGKPRAVPINDSFHSWLAPRKQSSGYVFPKENGKPYTGNFVTHTFKKAVRKLGVDESLHFHSLRHSTASLLAIKGISIWKISRLLGHSNISTTQVYSHLQPSDLLDDVNQLQVEL